MFIIHNQSEMLFVAKTNRFHVFLPAETNDWTYLQLGMHSFIMVDE